MIDRLLSFKLEEAANLSQKEKRKNIQASLWLNKMKQAREAGRCQPGLNFIRAGTDM